MHIEPLDTTDDAGIDAVVDLRRQAQAVDFPDDPKFGPSWEAGRIKTPAPGARFEWWLAHEGDRIAGASMVEFPELDNVSTAMADVVVRPDSRRRGVGTALAEHARSRAVSNGRKLIIAEAVMGGGAETFLRRQGASPGLIDHRQRLVIDSGARAEWDRLLAAAYPHSEGYTIVRWRDAVPAEYQDGMAYLTARMSTDIPLDQLEWGPEAWDAERIRAKDAVLAAWGRSAYTTAAVHDATRHVVAYTTLSCAEEDPTHAWQWNTIVEPAHRGHRLGTVVKAENLAFALEHQPETRTVITWNAVSNGPMNAINTALGFTPIDHWGEWQLRLP